MTEIGKAVDEILHKLASNGIDVAVYRSRTSQSVYMTLDYGVLKQIRISDHKASAYKYTFEIGSHIHKTRRTVRKYRGTEYPRYLFNIHDIDGLVTEIMVLRSNIKSKYSKLGYQSILDKQMELHLSQRHLPKYLQSYAKMNSFEEKYDN